MSKSHDICYEALRNVTSPVDKEAGFARHCGVARADQFFLLPDDQNVREYLQTEVNGKPIKKQTAVNNAIRDTLENNRDRFPLLNGGITVIAAAEVDDKARVVRLTGSRSSTAARPAACSGTTLPRTIRTTTSCRG